MNRHHGSILSLFFGVLVASCGGGGGGGGGTNPPGPVQPPQQAPAAPSPQQSGIVAAAAGSGTVRIDCNLPGTGFEAALFHAASASGVYGGAPSNAPLTSSSVIVTGLTDGADRFFGLAIRATGTTPWSPVGSIVRTRPAAPIYVDASANAGTADGQSPATAFPNLQDALLVAGSLNGGNVWIRDGNYSSGPYALGPNVHAAGGFDASFTLASRDATAGDTRLVGTATQEIVSVQSGGGDASLDGVVVDGGGVALKGIDVVDSDVELRSVTVRRCADRGIKAAVTAPTPNRELHTIGCVVSENGSDGLSSAGPIDLHFDLSRFDGNGQEGADIDDLQALDNGSVSLRITGCRFFGNVFEGLDVDLATAPLAAGSGTFDVSIENTRFEVNGLDGLLVDQEHEAFPAFRATIVIRGCVARGNRAAGVHVDADAAGTYDLDLLRCTANGTDGVLITSESNAGSVLLRNSWLGGNLGTGARLASGSKTILASHCAFSGNQLGGLRSDSIGCAVGNSVFVRQSTPLTNAIGAGNVTSDGSSAVFVASPTAFTPVSSVNGNTLTVTTTSGFAAGASVQAGDDGQRLVVGSAGGSTIVVDATPQAFLVPGMLTAHAGSTVADDLRLATGSPATAAGLAAVGETSPDAGPHGSNGGGEPGTVLPFAAVPLRVVSTAPALPTGVFTSESLVVTFDRALDVASVTADRVRVLDNGTPVTFGISVSGATLTLTPPGSGWSGSLSIRLLPGLRGTDGVLLGTALLAPLRLR